MLRAVIFFACISTAYSFNSGDVDRHRDDADLDPDPTFYFEADPDPQVYTCWKTELFKSFIYSHASFTLFYLS